MKKIKKTLITIITALLFIQMANFTVLGQSEKIKEDGNLIKLWAFIPDPVFKIDNKSYNRKDFLGFVKTRLNPENMKYITEKQARNLAPKLISDMIDNELLMKCIAEDGVLPSKKMVIAELDKDFNALNEDQQNQLSKELFQKHRMNFEQYKNKIADDINNQKMAATEYWINKYIKPSIKISDADIKKFYDESGEVINASHILIKPKGYSKKADEEARKNAEIFLARLKKGEKFEALVKESSCPNPDLGEFPRGKMVQEFDDAAFKLKPGEYSNVVKTPFGYHIIKLNSKRKIALPELDKVVKQIKTQLTEMRTQDAIIARVQTERFRADIKKYYKDLSK